MPSPLASRTGSRAEGVAVVVLVPEVADGQHRALALPVPAEAQDAGPRVVLHLSTALGCRGHDANVGPQAGGWTSAGQPVSNGPMQVYHWFGGAKGKPSRTHHLLEGSAIRQTQVRTHSKLL